MVNFENEWRKSYLANVPKRSEERNRMNERCAMTRTMLGVTS